MGRAWSFVLPSSHFIHAALAACRVIPHQSRRSSSSAFDVKFSRECVKWLTRVDRQNAENEIACLDYRFRLIRRKTVAQFGKPQGGNNDRRHISVRVRSQGI